MAPPLNVAVASLDGIGDGNAEGDIDEEDAVEFKLASSLMIAVSVCCHMATNGVAMRRAVEAGESVEGL